MKTVLYGAGYGGYRALNHLNQQGLAVDCFCDSNPQKWNTIFNGKPVISPLELRKEECELIITAYAFEAVIQGLATTHKEREKLRAAVRIFTPRYCFENADVPNQYDLSEIYAQDDRINRRYLDFYENGFLHRPMLWGYAEVSNLPSMDYFTGLFDVARLPDITYLDVGTYDGISIKQVYDYLGQKIRQIYAFEPSADTIPTLEENLMHWQLADITTVNNFALGENTGCLSFSGVKTAFGISGESLDAVRCLTGESSATCQIKVEPLDNLDLALKGRPFIKMDIEGMELDALKGMENFIKHHKPVLACCVYHRANDEYTLPMFIRKLVPDYKFYLSGGFHAVCYAVPGDLADCVIKR